MQRFRRSLTEPAFSFGNHLAQKDSWREQRSPDFVPDLFHRCEGANRATIHSPVVTSDRAKNPTVIRKKDAALLTRKLLANSPTAFRSLVVPLSRCINKERAPAHPTCYAHQFCNERLEVDIKVPIWSTGTKHCLFPPNSFLGTFIFFLQVHSFSNGEFILTNKARKHLSSSVSTKANGADKMHHRALLTVLPSLTAFIPYFLAQV